METKHDSGDDGARAVCLNRNEFHWAVAENAGEERFRDGRIFYTMAKGLGPIRLVSQLKLDSVDPDASFAELVRAIRDGRLPQNVAVDVLCSTDDLGWRLEQAGAIPREQTLMALDLRNPAASAAMGPDGMASEGVTATRITEESIREWAELPTRWLWNGDEAMLERNVRLYLPSVDDRRFAFFMVRSGGRTVSSALLFGDKSPDGEGGTAGIYAVATPEPERGKGYGGLATRACIEEARRRGFAQVVLYATALGKPVYERLGFRIVGKAVTWRLENTKIST